MKYIKDFFYNLSDLFIILLILAIAGGLIYWRVNIIMDYPEALAAEIQENGLQGLVPDDIVSGNSESGESSENSESTDPSSGNAESGEAGTAEAGKENAEGGQSAEPGKENSEGGQSAEPGKENAESGQSAEPGKENSESGQSAEPGKENSENAEGTEGGKENAEAGENAEGGENSESAETPTPGGPIDSATAQEPGSGPRDNTIWKDGKLRVDMTVELESGSSEAAVESLVQAGLFSSYEDFEAVCDSIGVDHGMVMALTYTFPAGSTQEDIVRIVTLD